MNENFSTLQREQGEYILRQSAQFNGFQAEFQRAIDFMQGEPEVALRRTLQSDPTYGPEEGVPSSSANGQTTEARVASVSRRMKEILVSEGDGDGSPARHRFAM